MTIATIPCEPPVGRDVGFHCGCWTSGNPCCWCGNDDVPGDANEHDLYVALGQRCPS